MNKIIITGITGFVGSNLKAYLEKEYDILGVSRSEEKKANIISYSALKRETFNTSQAFIHLAGKAHDLKKISSEKEYFEVNTDLTVMLFKKFLKSDCKVFIYISSVKAAADSVQGILDEQCIPLPQTAYGRSKLAAENHMLEMPLPTGKYLYILRPAMIHGPNNKGNLNLLYQFVNKGIPYPLGAFENKRSFVSVGNFCFTIQQLIQEKPAPGIYNIADDSPLSTRELVKIIGEVSGKKAKIYNFPPRLIKNLARIGDLFSLPFTTERLSKLTENYIVSNHKLKKAIQSDFPYNTRSGLKKTIESFNT